MMMSIRVGDQIEVLERVAVDQQEVRQRNLLDDADATSVGAARAGEREERRVVRRHHAQHLGRREPRDVFPSWAR